MLLPVEGYHLRVVDMGRGRPLLLHSGWVASWELWLPMMEVLQEDWRCVAYDHRGAGASTFPPEAISASALVDDVFRVMDGMGLDRTVIAGESLGGLVCMQAVLRDPSRFLGLVVLGGFPRALPLSAATTEAIRADYPRYVDRFVAACLPEPDGAALHRLGVMSLLPAGPEAALRMSAAHEGVVVDLASIAVPTLVIHGDRDVIAPPEGARAIAADVAGAELVLLEGAGHVPAITRPRQVAAAVVDWWSRVGTAGT